MAMQLPGGPQLVGGGPAPYSHDANGAMRFPNSFETAQASQFSAWAFLNSPRVAELAYRRSFFSCTQHDLKAYDFNGHMMPPGPAYLRQGLFTGAQQPAYHVPFAHRRPLAPVRIMRTIVKRFTALLFGQGRWPALKVVGDPKSQDFVDTLAKTEKLHHVFTKGRNKGGAAGTVGFSWRFFNGKPRVLAHDAGLLHVHEWEDREELIPAYVTQLKQFERLEYDPERKAVGPVLYWDRRDWMPDADIVFRPAKVEAGSEPQWLVDDEKSVEHGDGFAHFVWVTNGDPDDDEEIDGLPDYHAVDEQSTALDIINSITVHGGIRNLDPTLVLAVERSLLASGQVKKGSENALNVGQGGSATYLETAGTAINAGIALAQEQRKRILETAECVIPDPDELTAAGVSSVAIEQLFSPMISQADVLRVAYGNGIERIAEQQIRSYRRRMPRTTIEKDEETGEEVEVREAEYEEVVDEAGTVLEEVEIAPELDLPPRVVETEIVDPETGAPTGEVSITFEPRELGEGGDVSLDWPPYFKPTQQDRQTEAGSLITANGGKAVLSHKSSVETWARSVGLDPKEEWDKITAQQLAEKQAQEGGMFPGTGGAPGDPGAPEEPAEPVEPEPIEPEPAPAPEPVEANPAVMLVNEERARAGLAPLPEPEGSMTVKEFEAFRTERAKERAKKIGAAEGDVVAEQIAPTPPDPAAALAEPAAAPGAPVAPAGPGVPPEPTGAPPTPAG